MRLVKQEDDEGCGLACIAMVAGTTYAAVRKTYREVLGIERSDKIKPTGLPVLKEIMRRHGVVIEGRMRHFKGRTPDELGLDYSALLKINPRREGDEWHWVIWDHTRGRMLDPKKPPYQRPKYDAYWKLRRISADVD
jgi:hypothetical protein